MDSLQEFKNLCLSTVSRIRRLFVKKNNINFGPCLTPSTVPVFHIPESSSDVVNDNTKKLYAEQELGQHHPLPFNTYQLAKGTTNRCANRIHMKLKEKQFEACKRSRKESAVEQNYSCDQDDFPLPNAHLPKIDEIVSSYSRQLDKQPVGAFFKRKGQAKQADMLSGYPLGDNVNDFADESHLETEFSLKSPQPNYRQRSSTCYSNSINGLKGSSINPQANKVCSATSRNGSAPSVTKDTGGNDPDDARAVSVFSFTLETVANYLGDDHTSAKQCQLSSTPSTANVMVSNTSPVSSSKMFSLSSCSSVEFSPLSSPLSARIPSYPFLDVKQRPSSPSKAANLLILTSSSGANCLPSTSSSAVNIQQPSSPIPFYTSSRAENTPHLCPTSAANSPLLNPSSSTNSPGLSPLSTANSPVYGFSSTANVPPTNPSSNADISVSNSTMTAISTLLSPSQVLSPSSAATSPLLDRFSPANSPVSSPSSVRTPLHLNRSPAAKSDLSTYTVSNSSAGNSDLISSSPMTGCRRMSNAHGMLGVINFKFTYLNETDSLKVHVIRGENIGGLQKVDFDMNIFLKVYLMPGKIQIQSSEEKRQTKDPYFNEEFFFTKLSLSDVQARDLCIKVYNNTQLLSTEYIGKIQLALDRYNLNRWTLIWRSIEPKVSFRENLGQLFVSLNLNTEEKKIEVTIGKAKGLVCLPNAPNPYVIVQVSQGFQNFVKKQTETKKNTVNPVFNDTLKFDLMDVSPESIDSTCIVITVLSDEQPRPESILGEVRLGYDSTEDLEVLHWLELKQWPGQNIGKLHNLMESVEVFL